MRLYPYMFPATTPPWLFIPWLFTLEGSLPFGFDAESLVAPGVSGGVGGPPVMVTC